MYIFKKTTHFFHYRHFMICLFAFRQSHSLLDNAPNYLFGCILQKRIKRLVAEPSNYLPINVQRSICVSIKSSLLHRHTNQRKRSLQDLWHPLGLICSFFSLLDKRKKLKRNKTYAKNWRTSFTIMAIFGLLVLVLTT